MHLEGKKWQPLNFIDFTNLAIKRSHLSPFSPGLVIRSPVVTETGCGVVSLGLPLTSPSWSPLLLLHIPATRCLALGTPLPGWSLFSASCTSEPEWFPRKGGRDGQLLCFGDVSVACLFPQDTARTCHDGLGATRELPPALPLPFAVPLWFVLRTMSDETRIKIQKTTRGICVSIETGQRLSCLP